MSRWVWILTQQKETRTSSRQNTSFQKFERESVSNERSSSAPSDVHVGGDADDGSGHSLPSFMRGHCSCCDAASSVLQGSFRCMAEQSRHYLIYRTSTYQGLLRIRSPAMAWTGPAAG